MQVIIKDDDGNIVKEMDGKWALAMVADVDGNIGPDNPTGILIEPMVMK